MNIVEILIRASNQASAEFKKAGSDLGTLGKEAISMGKGMRTAGLAITAGVTTPLVGFIAKSALAAAQVDKLDIVVKQLGKTAGYSEDEIMGHVESVRSMGIESAASREVISKFITAQLDAADAAGIARVAQDQAVISGMNSTETTMRLTDALISGNAQMFTSMQMTLKLDEAYAGMAASLGKNVTELSEQEKVQARVNAVMEYGTTVAGTYEAAMGDSGKQMDSFKRYIVDIAVEAGQHFTPALNTAVFGVKDLLNTVMDMVSEGGALEPVLAGWGERLDDAAGMIGKFNEGLKNMSPATAKTLGDITLMTAAMGPLLVVGGQAVIWAGKLATALGTSALSLGLVGAAAYATAAGLIYLNNIAAEHNATMVEDMQNTADSAYTYEDYERILRDAADAKGLLIDKNGELVNKNRDVIDSNYLLTEAEWRKEQALLAGAEAAATSDEHMVRMAQTYGEVLAQTETPIDIQIQTEAALAELDNLKQRLEDDLSKAYDVLVNAQVKWKDSVADDLVGGLQDAGLAGDEMIERLEAIDQIFGTQMASEYRYNVAYDLEMPELLQALLDDPGQFIAEAQAFVDYFMPLETSVANAQAVVDDLQETLDEVAKEYLAIIRIQTLGSPPQLSDKSVTYSINYRYGQTGAAEGARATGGPVYPGQIYRWREFGDEYFIPQERGQVVTEGQAAAMGGGGQPMVVNVTINTPYNFADRVWAENELAPLIRDQFQKLMARG